MAFGHDSGSAPTCPAVDTTGPPIETMAGGMTFHQIATIVAGVCALWAGLLIVGLIFLHATHFSNPLEQKQIIRVITIIPSFALISFLCVLFDGAPSPYIHGGLDIGEAIPMAAFFVLISTYLVPDEGDRFSFFDQLAVVDRKGNPKSGGGSLSWYKRLCFMVFQWVPISLILWIATIITMAANIYCATSNKPHFAHIWITIVRIISTVMAIMAILRLYRRMKHVLKPRGVLKQLFCFKFCVFLNFLQTIIFSFLNSSGNLKPNKYLTYDDISNGLPSLILCCEMAIIAPVFYFAYSIKPYKIGAATPAHGPSPQYYQGGPGGIRAILSALNVFDLLGTLLAGMRGRFRGNPASRNGYAMQSH